MVQLFWLRLIHRVSCIAGSGCDVSTEQVIEARAIVPLKSRELTTQLKLSQGRSGGGRLRPHKGTVSTRLISATAHASATATSQTQAKTMPARERGAADERKAKHKTNLICQISLLWNICKELFPGCSESENLALLKGGGA